MYVHRNKAQLCAYMRNEMALHYNENFIYINGRPVGNTQDVSTDELEACGFVRITNDFNDSAFDIVSVAEVKAGNAKGAPKAPGKNGPVPV